MQRQDAFQVVGQVRAPGRLALGVSCLGNIQCGRQVVRARHQVGREGLAVGADAADRHAPKANAVIAALAADHAGALALATGAVIRQCDLQRGVDRFRARIGEEDAVQPGRHDGGYLGGGLEGERVAHLERRRVVQGLHLAGDRVRDLLAAMAGSDAPQAGATVEDLAAVMRGVIHAAGGVEQARGRLVLAVGGKRHPQGIEIGDHSLGGIHTSSSGAIGIGLGGGGWRRTGLSVDSGECGHCSGAARLKEYTVDRTSPYRTVKSEATVQIKKYPRRTITPVDPVASLATTAKVPPAAGFTLQRGKTRHRDVASHRTATPIKLYRSILTCNAC